LNNSCRHIASKTIQFSRWSNTSYAIFNSIGRVVHIGFLSTIIHGLVTIKAIGIHGILELFNQLIHDEADEENLLLDAQTVLLKLDEGHISEIIVDSDPNSRKVSEDINYINYNIKERPLSGLFSFVEFSHFMENSSFFSTINQFSKGVYSEQNSFISTTAFFYFN